MMVKKQRSRNKYKIVLETNGIFILSFLFFLSSSLVFYLGASYGKSTRTAKLEAAGKTQPAKSLPDIDKLAVLNLAKNNKSVAEYEKKLALIDKSLNVPDDIFKDNEKVAVVKKRLSSDLKPKKFDQLAVATQNILPEDKKNNSTIKTITQENNGYTIQIAAMKNVDRANQLLKKLRSDNFDAYIAASPENDNTVMYRIRIGSNLSKDEAKSLLPALEKQFAGLSIPAIKKYGSY